MSQSESCQVFGDFVDHVPDCEEYLTLSFSPNSAARKQRWASYGLSADFLGDYFAAFFPGDSIPDSKINQRKTVRAAVSFIANELLENAVKYTDSSARLPVSISLHLFERRIIFRVINHASPSTAQVYQRFIQELRNSTLEMVYLQQLEKTATSGDGSCMGILTMMHDYAAQFGWKFQLTGNQPDLIEVNVLVYLDL
jgi:hypothetical protein